MKNIKLFERELSLIADEDLRMSALTPIAVASVMICKGGMKNG